jgi:hypothetical protein
MSRLLPLPPRWWRAKHARLSPGSLLTTFGSRGDAMTVRELVRCARPSCGRFMSPRATACHRCVVRERAAARGRAG